MSGPATGCGSEIEGGGGVSTLPLHPELAAALREPQGAMCLGSCVPLRRAVSRPISIDKDSHVYSQAAHLPERTVLFQEQKWMAQRGVLSFPAFHVNRF